MWPLCQSPCCNLLLLTLYVQVRAAELMLKECKSAAGSDTWSRALHWKSTMLIICIISWQNVTEQARSPPASWLLSSRHYRADVPNQSAVCSCPAVQTLSWHSQSVCDACLLHRGWRPDLPAHSWKVCWCYPDGGWFWGNAANASFLKCCRERDEKIQKICSWRRSEMNLCTDR